MVAALIGLGGSSLIPDYQRPEAPVERIWDMPADAQANARRVSWQEFFQSGVLKDLISQALTNNRDLRVAALNSEKAQAQYRISRADLLPTVNASGAGDSQRVPGDLGGVGQRRPWSAVRGRAGGVEFRAVDQHSDLQRRA